MKAVKTVFITITLLSFLIAGCVRDKKDELKPIVNDKNATAIELFNNKADYKLEDIKMSEFVDSVKFIILEETDESIIKSINKIIFTQEYIIAVDKELRSIFFFEWNGKYVKKIARTGQGPGEYLSMLSCMFDEQKQQFMIFDIFARKMLFYDIHGNLIRGISEFSEKAVIRDIINLPDGNFLCYTYDGVGEVEEKYTGLWEVDADGKFLRNYFTYNVKIPVMHGGSPCFRQLPNGVVSLKDQIHNDIYHYNNGRVEKIISYNIKDSKLPELVNADVGMLKDKKNIMAFTVQEKGNYMITYWIVQPAQLMFSLFTKNNNKIRYWDAFYSYDATIPGVLHIPIDSNRPDILVCGLSRDAIDEYLADPNLPEAARNSLQILIPKIVESENPVLELLYIKK